MLGSWSKSQVQGQGSFREVGCLFTLGIFLLYSWLAMSPLGRIGWLKLFGFEVSKCFVSGLWSVLKQLYLSMWVLAFACHCLVLVSVISIVDVICKILLNYILYFLFLLLISIYGVVWNVFYIGQTKLLYRKLKISKINKSIN